MKNQVKQGLLVIVIVIIAAGAWFLFRNAGIFADINAGTIKITVNDEVGIPLPEAEIKVVSFQTNETYAITQKDEQGFYTAVVRPGSYTVEAQSPGYKADSQPITITNDQTQELIFFLTQ